MPDSGRNANDADRFAAHDDPRQPRLWLAAYTRSRHEQQVARQLAQKQVEYLLPTYNKMRRFNIPQGTGRDCELSVAAD